MSYSHLSIKDRYVIHHLHLYKISFREIGRRLGRHHTTIQREIKRHKSKWDGAVYNHEKGEREYWLKKKRAQHQKRRSYPRLYNYVISKLKRHWSPEQISGRLRLEFPKNKRMRVCPETIYSWIYKDASKGGFLYKYLRRHHKKRKKQKHLGGACGRIKDRVSIHERPNIVDEKSRIGDWEGDTVMGAQGKGAVVTLVERKCKYLLAGKLDGKAAEPLSKVANKLLKPLPKSWKKTLTLDNGSEFSKFKIIEKATGISVYFADPYASWQRGLNENTNGLLRQFFPKGCDFNKVTKKQLASAVKSINNRPRKSLNYRTPNEVRLNPSGALRTGI